ncbi:MAG TPA: PAAR domain-containing protein [Buttiauxella sp.]
MSAIAIASSICSGHGGFPPRPAVTNEPFMTVNGLPVLVAGNMFAVHADIVSSHDGSAISTRPYFTVNGVPIVCVGDPVSCGSSVATGDGFLTIE